MDQNQSEKIALFRFGVIAPLVGLKNAMRGQTQKLIEQITQDAWIIPASKRSYISRSALLEWVKKYRKSGGDLKSLMPKTRSDKGKVRSMDMETESAIIALKKEVGSEITLKVFLQIARQRNILPMNFKASIQTLYRLFEKSGLNEGTATPVDRRKFEADLPNDLWQADIMHGPCCITDGKKKRKAFLFAIIDDHSRLIVDAHFYLNERLENFLDSLKRAFSKRGLPRKLYLDNGPAFRSHQLKMCLASLGVELVHSKAYTPQGKGKIERWFRTVRMSFLPLLAQSMTLEEINTKLQEWIRTGYESKIHDSTGQTPLIKFIQKIELIRQAPLNIADFFRIRLQRKVALDRTVSVNGALFEAPVELIGKTITLLVDGTRTDTAEVFFKEKSFGFLKLLDRHINSKVMRDGQKQEPKTHDLPIPNQAPPKSGQLFGEGANQ